MLLRELFLTAEFFQIIQRITLPGKDPVHCNLPHHIVDLATGKIVVLGKEHCVIFIETVQLVHPDMFLGLNAGPLELHLEKEASLKCRIKAAFKIGCGSTPCASTMCFRRMRICEVASLSRRLR